MGRTSFAVQQERRKLLEVDFIVHGDSTVTCRHCEKILKMKPGNYSGVMNHLANGCKELRAQREGTYHYRPSPATSACSASSSSSSSFVKSHHRQYLMFRPERRRSARLYDTLGVALGASVDEIKRAFRRLALQHHPDRCGETQTAKEKWDAIRFAYDVLVDPARANAYDRNQLELYDNQQTQLAQQQLATEELANTTHQIKLRVATANEKASAWLKQLTADSHGPNAPPSLDLTVLDAILLDGDSKFERGQWKESVATFSKATVLHPQLLRALTSRARAYLKCGLVDEALTDSYACIHLDKTCPESYEPLRMCFVQMAVPPLLKEVEERIQTLKMELIRQRLLTPQTQAGVTTSEGLRRTLGTPPTSASHPTPVASTSYAAASKANEDDEAISDTIIIDSDPEQTEKESVEKTKRSIPTSNINPPAFAATPTSKLSAQPTPAPNPAELLANLLKALQQQQQSSSVPSNASATTESSPSSSSSVTPNPFNPFTGPTAGASGGLMEEDLSWAPSFYSERGAGHPEGVEKKDLQAASSSYRRARHPPIPHKPTNARLRVLEQCREILWEELDQRTCGTVQAFAKLRRATSESADLYSQLTEPRYLVNGGPTKFLDRINCEFQEIERACFSRIFREYKRRLSSSSSEGVMGEPIEIEDDTEKGNQPIVEQEPHSAKSPESKNDPELPVAKKRRFKACEIKP